MRFQRRQQHHDRSCFKKNTLKPHRREQWVIPPKANSAFVAAMEDVLAVYTRSRDSDRPLVCLDETFKALIAETRLAIPMEPSRPARCDFESSATASPDLLHDVRAARRLALRQGHGSPHRRGLRSCPEGPRRYLLPRRQGHRLSFPQEQPQHSQQSLASTRPSRPPKPGGSSSGSNGITHLNTAAGSILAKDRSSPSCRPNVSTAAYPTSKSSPTKVAAWEQDRNKNHAKADWRFTTPDAHIKLKHLYPSI